MQNFSDWRNKLNRKHFQTREDSNSSELIASQLEDTHVGDSTESADCWRSKLILLRKNRNKLSAKTEISSALEQKQVQHKNRNKLSTRTETSSAQEQKQAQR